jgi:hypothetical protein
MKLIGSKTEKEMKEILIKGHTALFNDQPYSRILTLLRENILNIKTAYFLDHIPEQGEDIYTMLINQDVIVSFEMSRYDLKLISTVKIASVKDYKKRLSKINQIRLAVAIDLAKKDMDIVQADGK